MNNQSVRGVAIFLLLGSIPFWAFVYQHKEALVQNSNLPTIAMPEIKISAGSPTPIVIYEQNQQIITTDHQEVNAVIVAPQQFFETTPIVEIAVQETATQEDSNLTAIQEVQVEIAPTSNATVVVEEIYTLEGVVALPLDINGNTIGTTSISTQVSRPPCDMNPYQYYTEHGSDALYDLAVTRDGKICAYTVVNFCPSPMTQPYADWRLAMLSSDTLPNEGTVDDIVLYWSDVEDIAQTAGATIEDMETNPRIFILEDEFDQFSKWLILDSCSDPEGRFVLNSNGVYKLLDYLKQHIQ